MIYPMTLNDP